ncbi:hypothetical protein M9D40_007120 [Pasteurella multocida]|uniref:hypothetical protein n=1 Tax=Pasteurella multocida TaxID=747 RepID=UPI0023DA94B5|nr:hypothetical protein [Pasteurella multocida]WEO85206.1 hypothetical protein M9D40_007120 [Pasteurella multocida]
MEKDWIKNLKVGDTVYFVETGRRSTFERETEVLKIRYRIRDARLSLWYELINPEKVIEDALIQVLKIFKEH